MWADAFAEQEAGEAAAKNDESASEQTGEETGQGDGDDDISNMWDEAFAEQEAAGNQSSEEELGVAAPAGDEEVFDPSGNEEEGDFAELDDSDLEKLWDEALESSGDDDLAELSLEGEDGEEPDNQSLDDDEDFGELPAEGGDIVGQDELDALLNEAGGEVEISEGDGSEDSDDIDEEDFEPAGAADPFGDEGEIDAFVDDDDESAEEVPAAVAVEEPAEEEPEGHREEMDAPIQNRLIAGVVDTVLVGSLEGAFAIGTHFIVRQAIDSIYSNMEALALVLTIDLVTLFLLSFFYSVYFIGGWGGTPGQRVAGLVVVDLGDQPVGYMQAVLRYFGTLAAILPAGLGQILTLIDKKGRGLGDRLAGTKVIFRATL